MYILYVLYSTRYCTVYYRLGYNRVRVAQFRGFVDFNLPGIPGGIFGTTVQYRVLVQYRTVLYPGNNGSAPADRPRQGPDANSRAPHGGGRHPFPRPAERPPWPPLTHAAARRPPRPRRGPAHSRRVFASPCHGSSHMLCLRRATFRRAYLSFVPIAASSPLAHRLPRCASAGGTWHVGYGDADMRRPPCSPCPRSLAKATPVPHDDKGYYPALLYYFTFPPPPCP